MHHGAMRDAEVVDKGTEENHTRRDIVQSAADGIEADHDKEIQLREYEAALQGASGAVSRLRGDDRRWALTRARASLTPDPAIPAGFLPAEPRTGSVGAHRETAQAG